jgi:phage gpG-like protein
MNERIAQQIKAVMRDALRDIDVELKDGFDRNFVRQAFFTEKWQRRKGAYQSDKTLLVNTGALRRSISSEIKEDRIVFTSTEPYAGIHNDGGVITVTKKMKGYFWHKYKETSGSFTKAKTGKLHNTKENRALSTQAEFYRAMALKKTGSKIIIPCRRFIGSHPEVEKSVREIVEEHLSKYFNSDQFQIQLK